MAILEKRLNLRSVSNSKSCEECKRKEKVIGQLYDKMEGLEEAVDAFCKDQQEQQQMLQESSTKCITRSPITRGY